MTASLRKSELKTLCFVGAGVMGCFNALLAALAGHRAVMFDVNAQTLQEVPDRQTEIAGFLVGIGLCDQAGVERAVKNIRCCDELETALGGVDIVSESVFEDLALKRDIHCRLDALCPPNVLITTNTSGLLVSEIEDVLQHGERFAAMHSHLGCLLFDIVRGSRTSDATVEQLLAYVESLGATALLLKKENSGYVLNTLLGSVLTTAILLRLSGHHIEDIDRAWMINLAAPIGPFGLMDMFGLDVVRDSWDKQQDEDLEPHRDKLVPFLQEYKENQQLGMKTGQGFYRYPEPAYQDAGFLTATAVNDELSDALVSALIQKAFLLDEKGIVEQADIDRAWVVATGIANGPFGLLQKRGTHWFSEALTLMERDGLSMPANIQRVRSTLAGNI